LSEPEGRAGLTDKLDADVRSALGRIARVPQLLVACTVNDLNGSSFVRS